MAQFVDLDHLKFLLFEVLDAASLCNLERYSEFDKESFDLMLDSTMTYAEQVLYPSYHIMDEHPARYEDGKIIVHPIVGDVMRYAGENGVIGQTFDYDDGGMQLPHLIHTAVGHISQAANNHVTGYTGLTHGSADLIATFGSQELKDRYLPKMLSGQWAGTMCLTEPQAGSSLSDITTSATPRPDGSYEIKGQKIFISGGDHEYADNFVHLLLARIDGAPAGTKGISLFVVPKLRLDADEQLVSNDVITAGDYQKMGQKGYCTTHLVFGESQNCRGWLVGEANRGLKQMFLMMNAARIDVGYTAASTATAAYLASLQYAKERPQGRRITSGGKKSSPEPTLIINHPDVRRMLLHQRAITQGSVALLAQASYYHDMAIAGPEGDRHRYHQLLEILTPIAKTYPSEKGRESINNAVQVLGGYGYCSEFMPQQYLRDIRIMAIYEGTTGIQSLDLLGRKITMNNGEAMKLLTAEIIATIKDAEAIPTLAPYAAQLKAQSKAVQGTLMHLLSFAMQGQHERYIADATLFMEAMGTVVIAWQWLKMAVKAEGYLQSGGSQKKAFYEQKIFTMRFFYKYELSRVGNVLDILKHDEVLTIVGEEEDVFDV